MVLIFVTHLKLLGKRAELDSYSQKAIKLYRVLEIECNKSKQAHESSNPNLTLVVQKKELQAVGTTFKKSIYASNALGRQL